MLSAITKCMHGELSKAWAFIGVELEGIKNTAQFDGGGTITECSCWFGRQCRHGATAPWTRYRFRVNLLYNYRSEPPSSGRNEVSDRASVGRRSTGIMKDLKEHLSCPRKFCPFSNSSKVLTAEARPASGPARQPRTSWATIVSFSMPVLSSQMAARNDDTEMTSIQHFSTSRTAPFQSGKRSLIAVKSTMPLYMTILPRNSYR